MDWNEFEHWYNTVTHHPNLSDEDKAKILIRKMWGMVFASEKTMQAIDKNLTQRIRDAERKAEE